jgi:very-short-patch-repair endonuclease
MKPCFMMSPLAAAKFIKPGVLEFDLIVMDEASQLKPEDCLGALARGKQVVVVGDNQQLPPSRFFDAQDGDEDDDADESGFGDAESILDLARKGCDRERMLMWHYRSEHEDLINFSNAQFYDRKLLVFPSSYDQHAHELGIRYEYVSNGYFDAGQNPREAQVVAAEVIRHFKEHPGRSLGVGAFNKAQADLIEDEILRLVKSDPAANEAYDSAIKDEKEPFFVKNLENIQGDERDVIFVSCTYGKDRASGRVYQRFGPLNAEGGGRRLNVMLSRSKKLMKVFSSMTPDEIQSSSKGGAWMLRSFLEFCTTGIIKDEGAETRHSADSPYEIEVGREIERLGYACTYQYGVDGYRIDIAVKSKWRPQQYILGVEFDGRAYHSKKFARDRDRLREEVLKSRGWKIHRIWSTAWIKNRREEVQRLESILKEADAKADSTSATCTAVTARCFLGESLP